MNQQMGTSSLSERDLEIIGRDKLQEDDLALQGIKELVISFSLLLTFFLPLLSFLFSSSYYFFPPSINLFFPPIILLSFIPPPSILFR